LFTYLFITYFVRKIMKLVKKIANTIIIKANRPYSMDLPLVSPGTPCGCIGGCCGYGCCWGYCGCIGGCCGGYAGYLCGGCIGGLWGRG
jgi:hypothetical protein